MKRPIRTQAKTVTGADVMRSSLPPTPKSAGFDTISTPFVFDDGFLSFHIPSPSTSDDSPPSFSPTSSCTSSTSGNSPDSPLPACPRPALQRLAIWRRGGETTPYLYADTSNNPSICGTMSLEHLDSSSKRYDSVLTAIAELFCPFLHILIPLTVPSTKIFRDVYTMKSIVTISTPSRSPVRLMISIYNRGILTFQREIDMTEETPTFLGDIRYSTDLPQQFVDGICEGADGPCSQSLNMLDTIGVMRFVQQTDSAQGPYGKTILCLVCDFQKHKEPFPGQVKLSYLSSKTRTSQPTDPLSTPPPSRENQPDSKHAAPGLRETHARRRFPKLSVSIPPASMGSIPKGCLQAYGYPSPDRETPLTGVPQNVFPVTPLHQPEQSRGTTRSCAGYGQPPTVNTYRLILSSASPSMALFSAIAFTPELEESKDPKRARQPVLSRTSPSAISSSYPLCHQRPHTSASNPPTIGSQGATHTARTMCSPSRQDAHCVREPLHAGYGESAHHIASAPPRFSCLPQNLASTPHNCRTHP